MIDKLATLQSALKQGSAVREHSKGASAPPTPSVRGSRQADRVGKVNLAAWLHPDFKSSLRLIQAKRSASIQDLMAEALNDLFAKYDVPQVHK